MLSLSLTLLFCLAQSRATDVTQCSDIATREAKVFIDSEDYGAGQWQSQLVVERESETNSTDASKPGRLLTDVQHSIVDCGDKTKLRFVLSFSVTNQARNQSLVAPVIPPVAGSIPPGYELSPGVGYYKMYTVGRTYSYASVECKLDGANLVIINSEQELKAVQQYAAKFTVSYAGRPQDLGWFWSGVHEKRLDGRYVTVEGKLFSSTGYTRLYRPDVHRRHGRDAYVIHQQLQGYADSPMHASWAYVCEIPLHTAP